MISLILNFICNIFNASTNNDHLDSPSSLVIGKLADI